MNIIVKE